jgi:hypothetical protein
MTKTGLIMSTVPRREFPQVPVSWTGQKLISLSNLLSDGPAAPPGCTNSGDEGDV